MYVAHNSSFLNSFYSPKTFSYNKMKEYFKKELIPIYIEVEDGIRLERAIQREKKQKEPKYTELCRRFIADSCIGPWSMYCLICSIFY